MSKITFDPELMLHLKTIYGDAELSDKTLRLLYNTWKVNPEYIRNTAQLKLLTTAPTVTTVLEDVEIPELQPTLTTEVALDDLSSINNFNLAFAEANRRGLKLFRWRSTKANPSGLFGTDYAKDNTQNINLRPLPKPEGGSSKGLRNMQGELKPGNEYINYKRYNSKYPGAGKSLSWSPEVVSRQQLELIWAKRPEFNSYYGKEDNNDIENSRGYSRAELLMNKYQQGGTMNNQEELQKAFLAYLIQDAAALGIQLQSEQDLQAYAQLLGEEGIQAKYQEFMQKMQGGVKARLGAKLEYYRKLKGVCPDGSQPTYFKEGGFFKKGCSCLSKASKGTKMNEIQSFKDKRKQAKSKKVEPSDTIRVEENGKTNAYDLTGKHKQYPRLTNDKYRKLSPRKLSDVDLKDQARKNACGSKLKKKK